MARIKYSALVTEIAGSIAGTTFQRNAYGYTVKNKPFKVNPNTLKQNASKQTMSSGAQQWRGLTNTQRLAWENLATAHPIPSRLNADSFLNGYNYFMKHTYYAMLAGTFSTSTVPTGSFQTLNIETLSVEEFSGALTFTLGMASAVSGFRVLIFLSYPYSFSQTRTKRSVKFILSSAFDDSTSLVKDITTEYSSIWGVVPTERAEFKMVMHSQASGQMYEFPLTVADMHEAIISI